MTLSYWTTNNTTASPASYNRWDYTWGSTTSAWDYIRNEIKPQASIVK